MSEYKPDSDAYPARAHDGLSDKARHSRTDTAFPHSLAFIPAGLEVVPTNQQDKETVQDAPESTSQAEKEVADVWEDQSNPTTPLQENSTKRRICDVRRRLFWSLMASLIAVLALVIGLACGLGLRRSQALTACDSGILSTANSLVNLLKSGVSGVVQGQDDAETRYTIAMVRQLRLENPNKNVLVFRNLASVVHFDKNAAYCRTKLDLGLGFAADPYDTYIFDYGTFTLVGDGGYTNWCFDGNYTKDGNQVTFNGISLPGDKAQAPAPIAPALPPSSPARLDSSHVDGNYFVNCSNPNGKVSSGMAYYTKLNPGQNVGQNPNDYVDVNNKTYMDWTEPGAITFPNTSVTVQWSVFGGSETHAVNSTVGTANNGWEFFWLYKDAGTYLYDVDGWPCYSVYWAY